MFGLVNEAHRLRVAAKGLAALIDISSVLE
jgi:hypothetical protein